MRTYNFLGTILSTSHVLSRTVSRTVKSLRFYLTLSASLTGHMTLFHECLQKTWNSWVGDKNLYCSSYRIVRDSAFFVFIPWAPIPKNNAKRARWYPHMQWIMLQVRNLEPMEPDSFINDGVCVCSLLWRGDSFFFAIQVFLKR